VFEVVKTGAGYSSTPIILVNFDGSNGFNPTGSLIADANGNLFGTTYGGAGTVFEIVKSAAGYSSTPITLVNFNNANGTKPYGDLLADANGNLFGTTSGGGTNGAGMVFEITGSGFGLVVPPPANPAPPAGTTADMILRHNSGQYAIYDIRNNVIGELSVGLGRDRMAVCRSRRFSSRRYIRHDATQRRHRCISSLQYQQQ
jgi:hypothetical protein